MNEEDKKRIELCVQEIQQASGHGQIVIEMYEGKVVQVNLTKKYKKN